MSQHSTPKYRVRLVTTEIYTVELSANSPNQAVQEATELLQRKDPRVEHCFTQNIEGSARLLP